MPDKFIYGANTTFALECARRIMVDTGMRLGLGHPKVIELSQRLDRLVVEKQREIAREILEART